MRPIVIKQGGSTLGGGGAFRSVITTSVGPPPRNPRFLESVVELHVAGSPVVLVHGGGPEIDLWLAESNVETRRIDGLRVTDETALKVTEAVLCATINKRIVRACAALGARAVGISGEDGATLVAQRAYGSKGEDLGFVGEVTSSNPALINLLLAAGYLPIVAPLAIATDKTHAFNVNADLAAAAIAGALQAAAFVMITDVERVRRDPKDPSTGIDRLSLDEAREFVATPACEGGMKPKMQAAIAAVESGAAASYICEQQPIESVLAGNATIVSS
jgi:acetylglutamate kinase